MNVKKIISVLMIPILLSISACGNTGTPTTDFSTKNESGVTETQFPETGLDESFVVQEATDKLTLYSYTMNANMITPTVNIFREQYPEVDVEIVSLSDEEYETLLAAELPAGKGPDLIISPADDFGGDIYKTMDADLFVDLNQLLLRDDTFTLDGYVENVMNAGIYKGKRYLLPVEYGILPLMTTQEILEEEGVSAEDIQTYDGFLNAVRQYNEKYTSDAEKSAFSAGDTASRLLRDFLLYSDIRLIDYEKNSVAINETVFRDVMTLIKDAPKNDPPDYTDNMGAGLMDHRNLFDNTLYQIGTLFISEMVRIQNKGQQTPIAYMWRDTDNGVVAEVINAVAIPKASKNQVNAYRFLKILLSKEIQGGDKDGLTYLRFGHPVLENSLRLELENDFNESDLTEIAKEEAREYYIDLVLNVDSASFGTPDVLLEFVEETMTPYWEGKTSYDECYAHLVRTLELYKDE